MSNKDNDSGLNSIEGEDRGIPSANETSGISRGQKFGLILLIALSLAFLFGLTYYNKKKENERAAQPAKLTDSNLPPKTFDMPPIPKVEPASAPLPPASVPFIPTSPVPVDTAPPPPPPPVLDKSGSSVIAGMAGAGQGGVAVAPSIGTQAGSATAKAVLEVSKATLVGNRNFLLLKGTFLDCVLQTRLDSTVPGMTACTLTRDVYSDNGKVLLLERGSQVIGEYKSNVQQGQARIFVLWTRVKTPNGVAVSFDSPGTDPLGGSGLPGHIDTHFWKRFGNAILLSLIDDGFAYLANRNQTNTNSGTNNTNTNNWNYENAQSNAQSMANEALRNSINIPPTLYINHGQHINIYVSKDLDFSEVYDVSAVAY